MKHEGKAHPRPVHTTHRYLRLILGVNVFAVVGLLWLRYTSLPSAALPEKPMATSHVPSGMEVLWMMNSPFLPPYDSNTGRFRFHKRGCRTDVLCIDVGANVKSEPCEIPSDANDGQLVGCHDCPMLGFEPQLGFWSHLRNEGPKCTFAIPAAVAPDEGMMDMHISLNGHSSGLVEMDVAAIDSTIGNLTDEQGHKTNWAPDVKERAVHKVFTVRLDEVIKRAGMPRVAYLKTDAQGFDLEVVKSAGDFIRVVDRVKMESKADGAAGHYKGQAEPAEIKAYMAGKGFEFEKEVFSCCLDKKLEVDLYFRNKDSRQMVVHESCPNGDGCKVVKAEEGMMLRRHKTT